MSAFAPENPLPDQGEIGVQIVTPNDVGLRLDPIIDSVQFSTAAVGGFGSCVAKLPGRHSIPQLSRLTVTWNDSILYQGVVEDVFRSVGADGWETTVQAFGPRRMLDTTSVRRIWCERKPEFVEAAVSFLPYLSLTPISNGVRVVGKNVSVPVGNARSASFYRAVTIRGWYGSYTNAGSANKVGYAALGAATATLSGSSGTFGLTSDDPGTDLTADLGWNVTVATTFTDADYVEFTNLRVLGHATVEDKNNEGFYGGTLLRDLVSLVPGLSLGTVEDGTDFLLNQLDRSIRSPASTVVDEITQYYQREYAVWEDGRFDWITPAWDEPTWIVTLAQCSELVIEESVGEIASTVYVLYDSASVFAGWTGSERSSPATSPRNPYVRTATRKDSLVPVPFKMTTSSSAALAAKLAAIDSERPSASGRLTIRPDQMIRRADGQQFPAFAIRGGHNILIADLPADEVFRQGRDGQTLFHVAATVADLGDERQMTCELEGQTRRSDILLARLAAATRTITG